jgi:epoxyqueuosine reductase
MDEEAFGRWFNGSPVRRARFAGLRRNVAIAMGNSGEDRFLPVLREWAEDADPVLAETARWAMERLPQGGHGDRTTAETGQATPFASAIRKTDGP